MRSEKPGCRRVSARVLCVAVMLLLSSPLAWGQAPELQKAWQVYSVCLAASMEDAAVHDMGRAAAEPRPGRTPVSPRALSALARETCRPFRTRLQNVHAAAARDRRGEPIPVLEARLIDLLEESLASTQRQWVLENRYGSSYLPQRQPR